MSSDWPNANATSIANGASEEFPTTMMSLARSIEDKVWSRSVVVMQKRSRSSSRKLPGGGRLCGSQVSTVAYAPLVACEATGELIAVSDEMIELILEDAKDSMDGAVAHAKQNFSGVRTGRATPVLVEKMPVMYYGTPVPLQQLASFSVPEARMLVISPFDKDSVEAIEKAIRESDLGLSPSTDGVVLRLAFPALTSERRKDLIKVVRAMAEDGRIAIRNTRRSARNDLDKMKKDGDAPEDTVDRAEKTVDDLTKQFEADIDAAVTAKEEELLEV